jgi:hypothetical protein
VKSLLEWLLVALYAVAAVLLLLGTVVKAAAIKDVRRQRLRLWIVVVYASMTGAAVINAVSVLADSPVLDAIADISWGAVTLLMVSIPCGLPYFNKGRARLVRNWGLSALGIVLLYQGVSALLR